MAMRGQIERVLRALNAAQVRYLVVGGVAVVLHGHLRTTLDLDLVVQLESANLEKALMVLVELGFQPRAPVPIEWFADPEKRQAWVREKNLMVFSLWHPEVPAFEVDLFANEPFDFDRVYGRAVTVQLANVETTVISLDDLMEMKRLASRPRDVEDLEALSILRNRRGDGIGTKE